MNVAVLQWLLRNQSALLKIVDAAKGWKPNGTYNEKWAVVNAIALLVIPLLEQGTMKPLALLEGDIYAPLSQSDVAAEFTALAIDWHLIVSVVLPLVIQILQALSEKMK